jgi:phthiocerol/phenolphthiocerol synthesis type-I polyketide synthase D
MTGEPDPAALTQWLVGRLAELAQVDAADIDQSEPLSALGLDSLTLAGLVGELSELLGREVDVTAVFEYPTVSGLVRYLSEPGAAPRRRPRAAPRSGGTDLPVAVTGIACHVPGADTLGELWSLILDGRDAIGSVPAGRWDIDVGAASFSPRERAIRFGGFLNDVDRFDAHFFRVPREEAIRMDPQHRLLLQATWEALEDAGIPPSDLRASRTGVFVGITANEYGRRQLSDLDDVSALLPTGNALSTAANRISYLFDFRGPSLAVDTACSSSLVATHLAVTSLRRGESTTAVVAGVNLLLEPEVSIALARAGILAREGRCRPFDAAADGYVRSEGCIVVVLKPLAAAQADGDRVYAVIRGSAVNQDGMTNGLTAPNPRAQVDVLTDSYLDAGLSPGQVGYVECHGSGTLLGDPIEARAVGEVIGAGRAAPCAIGSIKANIGHLEAAAGLAGLVKAALALHHGVLPPAAYFEDPNPNIAFERLGLVVNTEATVWPEGDRVAGVSSFGFGGTNAHVVLAGAPAPAAAPGPDKDMPFVLAVSGRDGESAAARARQLAHAVEAGIGPLGAVAATATRRREHHAFRLAGHGRTPGQIAARLREAADRGAVRSREDPALIFVFAGQGDLARHSPVLAADTDRRFLAMLQRCDEIVRDLAGWSITDTLASSDPGRLDATERAQPAHVALQLALAARWEEAGIRPSVVVGHSLGEVAAAYVAGALSLEQAMRVALARGRAVAPTIGTGRMLIIGGDERTAAGLMQETGAGAEISAVNSAQSTAIGGPAADLELIRAACAKAGRFASWVPVEYPSHTSAMDAAAVALSSMLEDLDAAPPELTMVSTVTGQPLRDAPGAAYWGLNLRRPVRFADAVRDLVPGAAAVLEVSPQPLLRSPLRHLATAADRPDLLVIESVEPQTTLDDQRAAGLAALHEQGVPVWWDRLLPACPPVTLPAYPWRRDRYWYDRPAAALSAARHRAGDQAPLLGKPLDLIGSERQWQLDFSHQSGSELLDHSLRGVPVMPASGLIEVMLEAARAMGRTAPIELRDIAFLALLPLDAPCRIQTVVRPHGAGLTIEIHSRPSSGSSWTLHASALLVAAQPQATAGLATPAAAPDVQSWYGRCLEPLTPADLYARMSDSGLDYGPEFRRVIEVWRGDHEAIGVVGGDGSDRYVCHPAALDAALQVIAAAVAAGPRTGTPVPERIAALSWRGSWAGRARVLASAAQGQPGDRVTADLTVVGPDNDVLVEISGCTVAALHGSAPSAGRSPVRTYQVAWREQPLPPGARSPAGRWLVIGDGLVAQAVADAAPAGVTIVRHQTVPTDRTAAQAAIRASRAGTDDRPADLTATDVLLVLDGTAPDGAGAAWACEADQMTDATMAALETARALSLSGGGTTTRLWIVTRGIQSLGQPETVAAGPAGVPASALAAAWGLARVFGFENPELEIRCTDLGDSSDAPHLAAEVQAPTDESEIAWRGGRRYVRRLESAAPPQSPDATAVSRGAAYLVTGGLGGLGLEVARWLVGRGAGQVILMSRRPSAQAVEAAGHLDPATVSVLSGDVADPGDLARAIAAVNGGRRLAGVVHAAGVLADGPLFQLERSAIDLVGRAKVAGLASLLSALPFADLDWLVVFSSVAAVVGSPGQGGYCAAGAAMDALANRARQHGLPLVTINWGPWAEVGLAARTATDEQWRVGSSFAAIEPDEGIRLLERMICQHWSGVAVPFDFADLVRYFPRSLGAPFFAGIAEETDPVWTASLSPQAARARPRLLSEFVAPRSELERIIATIWVRSLGYDRVGAADGFFELGGDSVLANQVILETGRTLGVTIDPEEAFAELTVARLAELAERAMAAVVSAMTEEEAQLRLNQLSGG